MRRPTSLTPICHAHYSLNTAIGLRTKHTGLNSVRIHSKMGSGTDGARPRLLPCCGRRKLIN